ncbi:MAG TPA: acetylxylan esterase [Bryobacteraceae bacterium]|nr:acetylxylan esterase [Bryobacteraceae bacterium]
MNQIAQRQLDRREAAVRAIHTVDEARTRQQMVRAKILELIGGLPEHNGPLNARVTGKIEKPHYVIEKVIFESLPQYFVTANLYRPRERGKYPGVLAPLGHWTEGKPGMQQIAANLAAKGFVVLAYDPVGQGERQQAYDRRWRTSLGGGSTDQHILAGAQSLLAGESFARYRIWDAKRALDYLLSRPEVETDKIGCTGCSGGGTLTTYISALDPRIKVAAPACYINTFRYLFTGPTGDSEQSIPGFLAAGLDIADYIELFAPKPWLIVSTTGDFFPIDGARAAFQEASDWYSLYGAKDKIAWTIGHGGHGTPLEDREAIYGWMIRWLKDGHGSAKEEPVELAPPFDLWATESGQVDGRDLYEVIRESFRKKQSERPASEMLADIRKWAALDGHPSTRVLSETKGADFDTQVLAIESEPGLEISAMLYTPRAAGRKPAVLLIDESSALAHRMAEAGDVVLSLSPRGVPAAGGRALIGDWLTNTRAMLIGRDLAGMRTGDIVRGVELLAARPDVNAEAIRGAARGVEGAWLLMAAAIDPRISRIWLDRTPYSLRAALDNPLSRDLHDAIVPDFALHWDFADLVRAVAPRTVIWSDPTDWMRAVVPHLSGYTYRNLDEPDDRFIDQLLQ